MVILKRIKKHRVYKIKKVGKKIRLEMREENLVKKKKNKGIVRCKRI